MVVSAWSGIPTEGVCVCALGKLPAWSGKGLTIKAGFEVSQNDKRQTILLAKQPLRAQRLKKFNLD